MSEWRGSREGGSGCWGESSVSPAELQRDCLWGSNLFRRQVNQSGGSRLKQCTHPAVYVSGNGKDCCFAVWAQHCLCLRKASTPRRLTHVTHPERRKSSTAFHSSPCSISDIKCFQSQNSILVCFYRAIKMSTSNVTEGVSLLSEPLKLIFWEVLMTRFIPGRALWSDQSLLDSNYRRKNINYVGFQWSLTVLMPVVR